MGRPTPLKFSFSASLTNKTFYQVIQFRQLLTQGLSADNEVNIIIGVLTIAIGILSAILAWATWKLTRDRRHRHFYGHALHGIFTLQLFYFLMVIVWVLYQLLDDQPQRMNGGRVFLDGWLTKTCCLRYFRREYRFPPKLSSALPPLLLPTHPSALSGHLPNDGSTASWRRGSAYLREIVQRYSYKFDMENCSTKQKWFGKEKNFCK